MNTIHRYFYPVLKTVAAIVLLVGTIAGISSCTSMERDSTSSSTPREGS